MRRIPARLWRIPLRHALVVALPLQILVAWIVLQGVSSGEKLLSHPTGYWGSPPPWHSEQWRYFARDAFREDVADLFAPRMPTDDGLETFSLTIHGNSLASLNSDLPRSGKDAGYKPALLEVGDTRMLVKARYMGDNHWHWLYPQKSWRIKTKRGDPFHNRRAFNLKNPPSMIAIDETLITRLSRELGVLTPEVEPVKFLLNGTYGGLYLRWDLADESLLRRARRMPGSIYQGENAPVGPDGVSTLFSEASWWEKSSSRNAEQAANRTDIEALIAAINGDPIAFRAFAEDRLDLDAYASFIAIDRLFAGRHHDYNHNHKVYFDPYKGRFEPIQWDFGDWGYFYRQRSFDGTEYPLLTAMKRHPDIELHLQRRLGELVSWFTPDELARRLDELVALIRPALAADSQRDHRDWPARRDLRLNLVPCVYFGLDEFDAEAARRKRDFAKLYRGTVRDLGDCVCVTHFVPGDPARLEIAATGHVAAEWTGLDVRGSGRLEILQDRNRNGRLDDGDLLVASADLGSGDTRIDFEELLFPGLKKVPTLNSSVQLYGRFDLTPAPLRYRYFLRCDGTLETVTGLTLRNAVTGEAIGPRRSEALPSEDGVYSIHPWDLPPPPDPERVTIGPGEVVIRETRRFEASTEVHFAPGTTVRLGEGVSLLIRGKVTAIGTEEKPITFEPLNAGRPWGVMLLHGIGTAGSHLSHCRWSGGSIAEHDLMIRSGMVSVIDTRDIVLDHSEIGVNHVGDDSMHWGYVENGTIRDCVFDGARSDALDIDINNGLRITGCTFRNSGNDCLDLMTSRVVVDDCRFLDGGDKGISVGESSSLLIRNSRITRCVIGIEIKDESVADVDATTVIEECGTGINLYRKNPRYDVGGTLRAKALSIRGSAGKAVTFDKRSMVPADLDDLLRREVGP